jgi:hypothetical protein
MFSYNQIYYFFSSNSDHSLHLIYYTKYDEMRIDFAWPGEYLC